MTLIISNPQLLRIYSIGRMLKTYTPYKHQLYASNVISTAAEKSHHCKKIKDGNTVLYVVSLN